MSNNSYKYTSKKDENSTITYNVLVTWNNVFQIRNKTFDELSKELEVPGFRKGKAPKDIAVKNISNQKLLTQTAETIAQDIYSYILKQENIKPITQPKISLESSKENEDWKYIIQIALEPLIDYEKVEKVLNSLKEQKKSEEIWTPDKGKPTKKPIELKKSPEEQSKKLQTVLEKLIESVPCSISSLIIDQEIARRLTSLIDDLHKTGLTIETYLSSKKISIDQLKDSMKKDIISAYSIEFILNAITKNEKITVEQKDIDLLVQNAPDQKTKDSIKSNSYYYASYLLRQKTIDFLINL